MTNYYGIKIAKEGVNVGTATNKDLVFNSETSCLKILASARRDYTLAPAATAYSTVAHTVSLPLVAFAYIYIPSDQTYKAITSEYIPDTSMYIGGSFEYDASNLYLSASNGTDGTINTHIIYYLCYA